MIRRLKTQSQFIKLQMKYVKNKHKLPTIQKLGKFSHPLLYRNISYFATDHKYSQKTTRQIEQQIAMQKWKALQNTFKSLSSTYGLNKPTPAQLQNTKYMQPTKIQYSLETLRECSHNYPVYLYWELQKPNSQFNQVIDKVIGNLWKADEKETLQFLQFLYAWGYKKIDLFKLYEKIIQKYQLSMDELFKLLKKFQGRLHKVIQLKILKRLDKKDLISNQYSSLLKIINYFTVKSLLSDQFYLSITRIVKENINRIPPTQVLDAYIYYTYNINQHAADLNKPQTPSNPSQNNLSKQNNQKQTDDNKENLGIDIVKIIQNRVISPQCLKFYNGEQMTAFLHTFLKNYLILNNQSSSQQYEQKVNKIINRIELSYFSSDFSSKDKKKLLQICGLLPELKKQTIIALVQRELHKKNQKFDYQLLPNLFLISYQNNMLTAELKDKIYKGVIDNIFHIDKKDISRLLWLFTITGKQNLTSLYKKVQTIIEGGMNEFTIKDVCIIVWSMSAANYNEKGKFWENIQSYLFEALNKKRVKQEQKSLLNQSSWILWAYHNNKQLRLQTINRISEIILQQFSLPNSNLTPKIKMKDQQENSMTVFELTSILSFYYSINFPSQKILTQIKNICFQQFQKIVNMMEVIELCKCLKYLGLRAWKDKQLTNRILITFQQSVQTLPYTDIMAVVAILVSSGIKSKRVIDIITKLLERKKRLQSLNMYGTDEMPQQKVKQSKWKFPI